MDDRKMQIIQELMEQLQEEMGHSPDELGERLGRPKPPPGAVGMDADEAGGDMGDEEMEGGMGDGMEGDMEEPGDSLKRRIMKMRA